MAKRKFSSRVVFFDNFREQRQLSFINSVPKIAFVVTKKAFFGAAFAWNSVAGGEITSRNIIGRMTQDDEMQMESFVEFFKKRVNNPKEKQESSWKVKWRF